MLALPAKYYGESLVSFWRTLDEGRQMNDDSSVRLSSSVVRQEAGSNSLGTNAMLAKSYVHHSKSQATERLQIVDCRMQIEPI
jgi:hypothetical protein